MRKERLRTLKPLRSAGLGIWLDLPVDWLMIHDLISEPNKQLKSNKHAFHPEIVVHDELGAGGGCANERRCCREGGEEEDGADAKN
jgi:hypothetical protein